MSFEASQPCWAAPNEARQCFHLELDWRLAGSLLVRPQAGGQRAARNCHMPEPRPCGVRLVSRCVFWTSAGAASANEPLSWFWFLFMAPRCSYLSALFPKHFAVASIKRSSHSPATEAANKFEANFSCDGDCDFNCYGDCDFNCDGDSLNVSRKNGLRQNEMKRNEEKSHTWKLKCFINISHSSDAG